MVPGHSKFDALNWRVPAGIVTVTSDMLGRGPLLDPLNLGSPFPRRALRSLTPDQFPKRDAVDGFRLTNHPTFPACPDALLCSGVKLLPVTALDRENVKMRQESKASECEPPTCCSHGPSGPPHSFLTWELVCPDGEYSKVVTAGIFNVS